MYSCSYVFQIITQIFGKDVGEVIFIISTHCNKFITPTSKPPIATVLDPEIFEKEKIPYNKYYLFNNDEIYTKHITDPPLMGQVQTALWDNSTTSFRLFFKELESTTPISLKLTKEILQNKRDITNVQLSAELGRQCI